jgi:GntR family transcriptional regulator/MocR family aminotransferase
VKREVLLEALAGALPELRVRGIAAGLHVLLELPAGVSERDMVVAAERDGVRLRGLGLYTREHAQGPALVLGYGLPSEHQLREAVAVVAGALA